MDVENEENEQPLITEEAVDADDLFGDDEEAAEQDTEQQNADNTTTNDPSEAPKKRRIQINRLPNLNEKWLLSNNPGIHNVNSYFEKVKFKKGRNCEKENLKIILQRFEYFAHQCYPKITFREFVDKVERLSGKKTIKHALHEIRNQAMNLNFNNENNEGNTDDIGQMFGEDNVPDHDVENNQAGDSQQATNNIQEDNTETMSSPVITEDMKEMIRRKREEAIERRKQRLEQSMTASQIESQDTSQTDVNTSSHNRSNEKSKHKDNSHDNSNTV